MAVTTAKFPGANGTVISGTWTNGATGLNADDATLANTTIATKNATAVLESGGITFAVGDIPADALIAKVEVQYEDQTSVANGTQRITPYLGATAGTNVDHASSVTLTARTADITAQRPGGGSWTRADFTGGTLKVRVTAVQPNNTTSTNYRWDYVRVVVTYLTFDQKAFRGRNDDGSESAATWIAAQNTNFSVAEGTPFRLRFEIQETSGGTGTAPQPWFILQWRKNGGAWTNAFSAVTDVDFPGTANYANGDNATDQLTAGTGTFNGSLGMDTNDGVWALSNVVFSTHVEIETTIRFIAADVVPGDVFEFRIVFGSATGSSNNPTTMVYTATPSVTVAAAGGTTNEETGSTVSGTSINATDVREAVESGALIADTLLAGQPVFIASVAGAISPLTRIAGVSQKETAGKFGALLADTFISGADASIFSEAGAILADTEIRGADIAEHAEVGAIFSAALISGVDLRESLKSGALFAQTVLSGVDIGQATETGSIFTSPRLSGASVKQGAGKAGAIVAGVRISASDVAERSEAGALLSAALLAGVDASQFAESGAVVADTFLAGVDAPQYTETGAIIADTLLAGTDAEVLSKIGALASAGVITGIAIMEDATVGSLLTKPQVSGVSQKEGAGKPGTISTLARMSGFDTEERSESGSLVADTNISGVDQHEYAKAGALIVDTLLQGQRSRIISAGGSLFAVVLIEGSSLGRESVEPGAPNILVIAEIDPSKLTSGGIARPRLYGAGADDPDTTGGELWRPYH